MAGRDISVTLHGTLWMLKWHASSLIKTMLVLIMTPTLRESKPY